MSTLRSNPNVSLLSAATAAAACLLLTVPALADSQARIVRLSDVQGPVQIDKNTGIGFESAFPNLPIVQGTQLKTGASGRAEVEFEDGSTLRLTPNTTVEFSTLSLSDAGKRTSAVNLVEGMAYINWLGKSSEAFTMNFSSEKVSLDHPAHFRVQISPELSQLAVFKGDVEAESASGTVVVAKKKTATFASDDGKSTIADNVKETPFDVWDKEALAYHDQYVNQNAKSTSSPYAYGLSDLNYYGSYSNVSGYGMLWQPYFTGVGWSPFADGAWGWYPGSGYMFASAYPWGWLPYRYGNWVYVPRSGWMWQAGGFNNWLSAPRFSGVPPAGFRPLVAPTSGTVRTIALGRGGPVLTPAPSRFILNAGSAGLGVPRGSLGSLRDLNHQVAKRGPVEVRPLSVGTERTTGGNSGYNRSRPSAPAAPAAPVAHGTSTGHSTGAAHH
jgi:FecR protein